MARYPGTSIIYGSGPSDASFLSEGTSPDEVEYFTNIMRSVIQMHDRNVRWGFPSAAVQNGPHPYDLNQDGVIDSVDAAMAQAWLDARVAEVVTPPSVDPPYDTPTGDWPTNERDWARLSSTQRQEALAALLTEHRAVRDLGGGDYGLPALTGGGKDYRFMDANSDGWVSYRDYELLFGTPFPVPDPAPIPGPTPHPNPIPFPDPPVTPDPGLAPSWARWPVLVFGALILLAVWSSLRGRSVWDL